MEKETVIRPSLLACDFLHLGEAVEEMISLHINSAHFDVMDGNFVPSISFGQPIFQSLKPYFDQISFDVHLMVNNPLEQMDSFFQLGSEEVTIHVESLGKEGREQLLLMKAKYPGRRIGLALSPESDISLLFPYLDLVDEILIMSVVPGKGGQKYIVGSEEKIAALAKGKKESHASYLIGVDGGINDTTGPLCLEHGADFLVAGSYYFKAEDKKEALAKIHQGVRR